MFIVTIKHSYCITALALLLSLTMGMKVTTECEFLKRSSFVPRCIHISFEMCFTIRTIVAYLYLFYFVCSKSRRMLNAQHSGIVFDQKLMMTLNQTNICLLLFTIPYFVRDVSFIFPRRDLKKERNVVKTLGENTSVFIILHNKR